MSHLVVTIVVMLALWTSAHFYVADRFTEPLSVRWARVVRVLFGVHLLAVPGAMVVARLDVMAPLHMVANWLAFLSAGVFTLLLVFTLIRDLGWFGFETFEHLAGKGEEGPLADPGRRRWMKMGLNGGVITATALATRRGVLQARRVPDVVEVTVPMKQLPAELDGLRIVQLSDLHVGQTIHRPAVEAIAERADALGGDLVAITGDIAEGFSRHVLDDMRPLFELNPPHGVHYVTGNHEYYWDALDWCRVLDEAGLEVLLNDHCLVEHRGGRLLVAGCTDYKADRHIDEHASDPGGALEGAPAHDTSILLAHQPTSIEQAAPAGYDLQLSGHTHGGQFWPWNYIAGQVHEFSAGLGKREDTWIYVSRGTGYWGPPVRLAAPSEITVLTLRRGGEQLADERRLDSEQFGAKYG